MNDSATNKINHKVVMNWNAYPASSTLLAGALVNVSRYLLYEEAATTPQIDDHLFIAFPCNERAGGVVEGASSSSIAIGINGVSSTWEQQGSHQVKANNLLSLSYIVR